MSRFSKFINMLSPRTGRLIRENGDYVNEADLIQRQDSVTFLLAVEDGDIFTSNIDFVLDAGDTATFYQEVPEGKVVRGISLEGVFSGSINYQMTLGATAGAVLETLPALNLNTDPALEPSESNIKKVIGITGGTVVEKSFGITPATGAGRSASPLAGAGLGKIYYESTSPAFQFTNFGNQQARLALTWIWKRCCEV